jgi:hypothetical protein
VAHFVLLTSASISFDCVTVTVPFPPDGDCTWSRYVWASVGRLRHIVIIDVVIILFIFDLLLPSVDDTLEVSSLE